MRRRILPLFLVSAVLGLSACSTVVNQSSQPVDVVVRGSRYADCSLYTKNYRNTFRAPGKVVLERSRYDLNVDCLGEEGRRTKFSLSPGMTKETAYNVSNGVVPGGAYDALSGGMWAYPDPIIVDFRTTDDVPQPAPQWPPVTVSDPLPETAVGTANLAPAPGTPLYMTSDGWRMRPVQSPEDFYTPQEKPKAKAVKKKRTAKKAPVKAPVKAETKAPVVEETKAATTPAPVEEAAPPASEPAVAPTPTAEEPPAQPAAEAPATSATDAAPVVAPAEPATEQPAAETTAAPAAAPAEETVPEEALPQPSAPAESTPGTNVVPNAQPATPAPATSLPPSANTTPAPGN